MNNTTDPVLEIRNLKTWFDTDDGIVRGCDGVSYTVGAGETLAVVGESGSGKSVTAMSILRLIPTPPGMIVSGEILFEGQDLTRISDREMQGVRGNRIAMIFQEPMTSLNPVFPVGRQIMESVLLHENVSKQEARSRAVEMLSLVGIPSPEARLNEYPYQLSGGMRQRVMIAMALACSPRLLIADEPTSALDVTIQAQILHLIRDLQNRLGMSVIMITHDLGVVAQTAHRVAVMYSGQVVEQGTVDDIFTRSGHPYVEGLKRCIPRLDGEEDQLYTIEGMVPNPLDLPPGCRFAPRCPRAMDVCREREPEVTELAPGHEVRCWLHTDHGGLA